ncbi:hypothetical protein F5Y01DRAFT_318387 [Xylaria sp. FL0043]|nr:hypothetical protein F5Y01DRAFT_318387 [Xylaria sp. FL0043]
MALTQENVAKLPSDGSPFFSSHSGTITPRPPTPTTPIVPRPNVAVLSVGASPSVRLRQAKESVYFYMRELWILSVEGYRIVKNSELYMAGKGDVRFRHSKRRGHEQDMDNPDYWEAKARFFQQEFEPLYRARHPKWVFDPNSAAQLEQDEMDRACFRWERRKKFIEEWRSVIGQEVYRNFQFRLQPHCAPLNRFNLYRAWTQRTNQSLLQQSQEPANESGPLWGLKTRVQARKGVFTSTHVKR